MEISIGSDHAGYDYKRYLTTKLESWGHTVKDYGTDGPESVDYPDFAHPVAQAIAGSSSSEMGVLICGSANGVCMTANKTPGVRAAISWEKELAQLARQHNDANILCIPARFVSKRKAASILKAFLDTEFEGGRHKRRVDKIGCM